MFEQGMNGECRRPELVTFILQSDKLEMTMPGLKVSEPEAEVNSRYRNAAQAKATGATYTPNALANFVAEKMFDHWLAPSGRRIRVLDPAVGDGALLESLLSKLPQKVLGFTDVVGYDTDAQALSRATARLQAQFPEASLQLQQEDFLQHVLEQRDLFSARSADGFLFDLVIANPPYVRTQVIGAKQAQQLADAFGLTGRVDLYYPFVLGIAGILAEHGVAGIITSNRFMTTKAGTTIRREVLSRFRIQSVWDLGDTKLFDAAVLPSVLIAKGRADRRQVSVSIPSFSSIYESREDATRTADNPVEALAAIPDAVVAVPDGRKFIVRHGLLDNQGSPEGVWRVATKSADDWLATVAINTWDTFRRIGKIRVGVKSTADKIFIRSDWNQLPGGRPELLRPLITRHCGAQFRARLPVRAQDRKEILYPHESTDTGRRPVDLAQYPVSARYLEKHRTALQSRTYVIEAGRQWYELWVPQDPAAWARPKMVFLDIAEEPTFWLDDAGGIVNGECYWLQPERNDDENLLWLALGVANSTFITEFYDHRFNNKLYSQRRRFITQYVEHFPLPDPRGDNALTIIRLSKALHGMNPSMDQSAHKQSLNAAVWKAFGLSVKQTSR